jgi:ATP-dependent DNA helicase RecG
MPERSALTLRTPLTEVKGITSFMSHGLSDLGITNVGTLVAHLPMRHEALEAETSIADLVIGQIGSARGEIAATRLVRAGRSPRFEAVVIDGADRLDAVWFNQPYMKDRLRPGMLVRLQGKCQRFGPGMQMVNPRVETFEGDAPQPAAGERRLRPVYPASEAIDSRAIERAVGKVLADALPLIDEHLPEPFRAERQLPALDQAYRMYHAPASEDEVLRARRRLAYDELLLLQLGVHIKRAHLRRELSAPALRSSEAIDRHIRERLAFELTPGQNQVVREITADLTRAVPTNRLIQGDVGSGKTAVALYAMLLSAASKHQSALMAPTEILAEQHHASITRTLRGSRVRVELLTGSTSKKDRAEILERLAAGEIDILVGTHALLTEDVRFHSLGVAIVDEQHRFGVHQRATLRGKSAAAGRAVTPHVLVMTATPIPRTLAITLFGDLDISTIAGMPPGRSPIRTRVVAREVRDEVYAFVKSRLDRGEQAYVVVPAIDPESQGRDEAQPRARTSGGTKAGAEGGSARRASGAAAISGVTSVLKELTSGPLAGKRLAAIHGRLDRGERDAVMEKFRAGEIDALVATTVIEVGVDVPNATVMVVEDADRFGLAQLHQLRGRVGRGAKESACILIAEALTDDARRRLEVVAATTDGFALSEKDLEIRGPGELFGTKQSGLPPLKAADLMRDRELLSMARRDASAWIDESPRLGKPEEKLIRRRLLKAYGTALGLGDVG